MPLLRCATFDEYMIDYNDEYMIDYNEEYMIDYNGVTTIAPSQFP